MLAESIKTDKHQYDRVWNSINDKISEDKLRHNKLRRIRILRWSTAAAVFIGILLGSIFILRQPKVEMIELTADNGTRTITLPDSTKVWLNRYASITYPKTFADDRRTVYISGEAYFEVAKNKAKPFRVEVDRVEVVVLGTSFNIHAYDEAVKTTLVEGAVKLNVAGKAYSLSPGFEANVDQGGVKIVKSDVYEQIAWKDGRFVFREKRLEEVMSILSRWYDFEIFYQNAAVKDLHFTGNIPRHTTINEVLKFLERTHLVHFSVVGRTVIVSE